MGLSLTEIAEQLKNNNKKVQLIYAFNGVGKTRLSREFKELVQPKHSEDEYNSPIKFLYYNAFTEDLFVWDNDLDSDENRKITIRPNNFTSLAFGFLKDQGQDGNISSHFQHYTNSSITPKFNEEFSEVTFSLLTGGDNSLNNIKISKGEESNFIWCVFYSLIEQVIETLNIAESEERPVRLFDDLEYIFIDDPVTSLDENHLIELAVDLAQLIKSSDSEVKFIITTHNPLFYNVLYNELKKSEKYLITKLENGSYQLENQNESPFAYHLYLLQELVDAAESDRLKKYHFNFLRNVLEKTAVFLGYENWTDLLPQKDNDYKGNNPYEKRIINFLSHSKNSAEEIPELTDENKKVLSHLIDKIKEKYYFKIKTKESQK